MKCVSEKKCLNCGDELSGNKSKYCSLRCNLTFIGRVAILRNLNCVQCGNVFQSKVPRSKYCSSSCMINSRRGKYKNNNLEARRGSQKKYSEKFPDKLKAQKLLQYSVRRGYVIRPDYCEICLINCKPHGHHSDYSKPLNVLWLCPLCHKKEHLCQK